LVEGNHDVYFGEADFERIVKDTPIKLLSNEFLNVDGVQLI
jgi:hypothetical protein